MSGTLRPSFVQRGFARVDGAFPRSEADVIADLIWGVFDREFGLRRADPSTWTRPFRKKPLEEIGDAPVFWNIFSDRLIDVIDELLDGAWNVPSRLGDFLITFPEPGDWGLPHSGWHSDEGFVPGVMCFVFFNDVPRGGGGTLIVSGSHRLGGDDDNARAEPDGLGRKWKHRWHAERRAQWLKDLETPGDAALRYRRFVETATEVDGVPLQVVELTGRAGDVVLCHPRLLHAIAPNASEGPRFMRTPRIAGARSQTAT